MSDDGWMLRIYQRAVSTLANSDNAKRYSQGTYNQPPPFSVVSGQQSCELEAHGVGCSRRAADDAQAFLIRRHRILACKYVVCSRVSALMLRI